MMLFNNKYYYHVLSLNGTVEENEDNDGERIVTTTCSHGIR